MIKHPKPLKWGYITENRSPLRRKKNMKISNNSDFAWRFLRAAITLGTQPSRPRLGWRAMACAVLLGWLLNPLPVLAQNPQEVQHTWKRLFYGKLDGRESLMFANKFDRTKPALGDLDGDGDKDLLLGQRNGRILFFENQGRGKPIPFRLMNEALSAQPPTAKTPDAPQGIIDVGENAAPALVDMDKDGDLDLFVGAANGRLQYYANEGNKFLPLFRLRSPDFLGARFGLNLVPRFADLNGDAKPELTLGNEAGQFFIIYNEGSRSQPRFCASRERSQNCLTPPRLLGQVSPEDNAVPAWVDWDQDGDLDLMVGKNDGTLDYYQNLGTRRDGVWELKQRRFNLIDVGGYAAPLFMDMNGDKKPDLLMTGDSELVHWYSKRKESGRFILWVEEKNLLQVRRLGNHQSRLHIASGDLNGDRMMDVLVGTRAGRLLIYHNAGGKGMPAFRSPKSPLLRSPSRAFSAPALVDLDGDRDMDMVVGGHTGRLEWIENTGNTRQAKWRTRSLFFASVDVGSLSVPVFQDLDGDKDLDMVVGNSLGNVVLFENAGRPNSPRYQMRNIRFGGVPMMPHASPAFFAWNPGKKGTKGASIADLVVGNQEGKLHPAARNPSYKLVSNRGFAAQKQPWRGLQAETYSAPHFTDITGDGLADLLLGTGNGALLVWQYLGSKSPQVIAQARRPTPGQNIVVEGGTSLFTQPKVDLADLMDGGDSGTSGPKGPGLGQPEGPLPLEPVFVYEASPLEKLRPGKAARAAFLDINGDSRPDMVVGTRNGKLTLYHNKGPAASPGWRKVDEAFVRYKQGRNPTPTFVDLDKDGDQDLVVGNERGEVFLWENTGGGGIPKFKPSTKAFFPRRTGKNAVPAFNDLNGDGLMDMVVGTLKGQVMVFQRLRGKANPFKLVLRQFIGLDVGINATPTFYDLTLQSRPYLLVGSDSGHLRIFAPTGTNKLFSSGWQEKPGYLEGIKTPMGSHPAVVDLDGDGDPDLVVGSDSGQLVFYRNHAKSHAAPAQGQ